MQRFTKKDASLALRGHEAGVIDQVGDICISCRCTLTSASAGGVHGLKPLLIPNPFVNACRSC